MLSFFDKHTHDPIEGKTKFSNNFFLFPDFFIIFAPNSIAVFFFKDNYYNKVVESFDLLFREYYAPMVLYADSRLGNREQAEDVVQDVFKKLLEMDSLPEDEQKKRQFLFTILKNKIIDIFRYNQRHQQSELQDVSSDDSIEDTFFEIELYERLYKEVQALPEKISEAMQLRMQGYDNHEIAEILKTNYHTVRSRIQRGIVMLRDKFEKHFLYSFFL